MKYLILIFIFILSGCHQSPESIKIRQKLDKDCVNKCAEVNHEMDNVDLFFGCFCKVNNDQAK